MSLPAVDAALGQAVRFTEQLVETYATQIAAGEVGPGGSATASEVPISASLRSDLSVCRLLPAHPD